MRFNIEDINQEGLFTGEVNNLPSMVEPCHNPTISEMLLHPELMVTRGGSYDEGESLEEVPDSWDNDIQDFLNEVNDNAPKKDVKGERPSSPAKDMPNENVGADEPSSEDKPKAE